MGETPPPSASNPGSAVSTLGEPNAAPPSRSGLGGRVSLGGGRNAAPLPSQPPGSGMVEEGPNAPTPYSKTLRSAWMGGLHTEWILGKYPLFESTCLLNEGRGLIRRYLNLNSRFPETAT